MTHHLKPIIASIKGITLFILFTVLQPAVLQAQQFKPIELSKKDTVNRIILKGNVEIELVQRKQTGIHYIDENSGTAKVILRDRALHISSTGTTVCRMVVYVDDIYRLEAEGNAMIKTRGCLQTRYLQVFMKDHAMADIQIACEGIYTKIADDSKLTLGGHAQVLNLCRDDKTILTLHNFAANQTTSIPMPAQSGNPQTSIGK